MSQKEFIRRIGPVIRILKSMEMPDMRPITLR
jgi:hypothetical protein